MTILNVTERERQLVKDYLLLPIMLDVLERDIAAIGRVKLKFPNLYTAILRSAQDAITTELHGIRKVFRHAGIKVYDEIRTKEGIEAKYLCRGYEHSMMMLWELVKVECEIRLAELLGVRLRAPE